MIINIHAGHNPDGKIGCGAVGLIKESTEARLVKDKVIAYLKELEHTVYDCTVDNGTSQTDVLDKIVTKCNAHTVDLDISIHFNSGRNDYSGDGSIGGTEVWVYNKSGTSYNYAKKICESISALGFRNRGVKTNTGLFVLANTNAQALLVECCFVDDKDDINIYNADKMAQAIVKGITEKKVETVKSNTATTATVNDFKKWLNSYLKITLPIDGVFSKNDKKAAIMTFQKISGLKITGAWNSDCSNFVANNSKMHARIGDSGDIVKLLQGMLIANGIYLGELHGKYDENTKNTVLHFQKFWNLNQHGIAGTQVWKKLLG